MQLATACNLCNTITNNIYLITCQTLQTTTNGRRDRGELLARGVGGWSSINSTLPPVRRSLKLREISSVVIYLNLFGEYGESLIRALLGHPHLTSIHLDRNM